MISLFLPNLSCTALNFLNCFLIPNLYIIFLPHFIFIKIITTEKLHICPQNFLLQHIWCLHFTDIKEYVAIKSKRCKNLIKNTQSALEIVFFPVSDFLFPHLSCYTQPMAAEKNDTVYFLQQSNRKSGISKYI